MPNQNQAEQVVAQLRGLLCAPDAGTHVLPAGIEHFSTEGFLSTLDINQLSDYSFHSVFGKRMEQLLKHSVQSSDRYNVIADNIQIIENGLTIGELDFILHDLRENKLIHLELAVKFYLFDPTLPGEEQRWIGPNRRDSLDRKLLKLKSHQFPLLYHPETQNTIRNLDLPDLPIAQALCFKTMLFVPEYQINVTPEYLNPKALSGTWIRLSDFQYFRDHLFFLPDKPEWICDPTEHITWNDYDQTHLQLKALITRKRSPMCWMKSPYGQTKRFFVVWW